MKKFLLSLVAGIAVALTPAVNATETISFSYNANNDEPTYEGIQGITDYDIAILIRDTNLAGSKIKGFKVPVNFTAADVKSMSGWLSVTLRLDADGNNNPGICTQAASIADGFLSVTFDEPYEITKTGVYVGYSFSLNSTSISDPLSCTPISNTNAFYIHSANTAYSKWTNVARDLGMNVPMVVYIEGDFPTLSVNCTMPAESNAALGDENFGIQLTITNNGANPVTSVGYTTSTGDKSVSTVTEVNPPLEYYNGTATVNLALPEITSSGSYNLNVNVTTINGTTLATPFNLSGTLNVASHVVTRRPLVEEYTGLWCGWCPRGYVAMEDMSAAYGHEFVGLAYHNGDEMATVASSKYPNAVSGFPSAYIDRTISLDPGDIYEKWGPRRDIFSPADIAVSAEWADEAKTTINATSTTTFAMNMSDIDYRIQYVMLGDGMSDPYWAQTNYYRGYANPNSSPLWDTFTKGASYVMGLVFNDVVLITGDKNGIPGSVPSTVTEDTPLNHSTTFALVNANSIYGKTGNLAPYAQSFRVIAILLDGNGNVLNCASSNSVFVDESGVKDVVATESVVNTTYVDLQGRTIENPAAGQLVIRRDTLSNGTIRATKEIIR